MPNRFVTVHVEEHAELPDGCSMRFRATGEARPIVSVRYESDSGTSGQWHVVGVDESGAEVQAITMPVDDSGAGTSFLVIGGSWGLRLSFPDTGEESWAPYLLLAPSAVGER